ncbi:MAG: DUF2220 family protein [Deltaproteobacteria bacterium]|jgi:hypothetical protein|nr:DUF2220 family protein [Deltaproteobacteria bacterium]
MKFPDDVEKLIGRDYRNPRLLEAWLRSAAGLGGEGLWPRTYALNPPSEREARADPRVWEFIPAWRDLKRPGRLGLVGRNWPGLGHQTLPAKWYLDGPEDLAAWIGQGEAWATLKARYLDLSGAWPGVLGALPAHFRTLETLPGDDYRRLKAVLGWLAQNPDSGLYPRQLPIAGLDTKWLEARSKIIADLAGLALDRQGLGNFHKICGLAERPALYRLRLLDPALRAQVGGLGFFSAPPGELARLPIRPRVVFVVENLQTGLAFGDLPGSAMILGHGNALSFASGLPWLAGAEKRYYWGDIDRDGLAILARARDKIPGLVSIFMDERTLLGNRGLWGRDEGLGAGGELNLTGEERRLYDDLLGDRFGPRVRLEQERIAWDKAWPIIQTLAG